MEVNVNKEKIKSGLNIVLVSYILINRRRRGLGGLRASGSVDSDRAFRSVARVSSVQAEGRQVRLVQRTDTGSEPREGERDGGREAARDRSARTEKAVAVCARRGSRAQLGDEHHRDHSVERLSDHILNRFYKSHKEST